jgi:hypothetical protein
MKTLIIFIALSSISIGVHAQDLKYETIWSMYTEKKLTKMPKYIIEEAESFSIITWKDKTRKITISTSSPDGEEKIVMNVNEIAKETGKTTYKGIGPNGKMIITINTLTKWIVITNLLQDGSSMYEYHKV